MDLPDTIATDFKPAPLDRLRHWKRRFEEKAGELACPLQFAAVGLSGMVLDLGSFALLNLFLPLPVARALAIWLAMTWNFTLNRLVTFSYAPRNRPIRQYLLYCGSCAAGAVGSWVTSMALCRTNDFFLAHPVLAAIVGVGVGFGLNYCACRCFVFGARPRTRVPGAQEPFLRNSPASDCTSARQDSAPVLSGR